MGMKDQFQNKANEMQDQAKEKAGQARERAGQRGKQQPQQPQRGGQQPQTERGRQNMRDIEDPEREMGEHLERDYDA
ncbi:hypothetical protein ACGFT2_10130 [Streptomyces sp. NPDC048514]|uniref:hypothetical protein n=1 Tax=Streptomyces sp. NPDC048514 TaxID=3365564 RepID=UPI00371D1FC2